MFVNNTFGKIRRVCGTSYVICGTRFGWIASTTSRSNATNLSTWVSATRLLAILLSAMCCALSSTSAYAGVMFANELEPSQIAESAAAVLADLGCAVPERGFSEIELLTDESGCGTSQQVEQRQADPSALPMEQPRPLPTPTSSQLALSAAGQTFNGASNSRASGGGGGSSGLLSETARVLKSMRSGKLFVREFQFLPEAPPFELFHPS